MSALKFDKLAVDLEPRIDSTAEWRAMLSVSSAVASAIGGQYLGVDAGCSQSALLSPASLLCMMLHKSLD